MYGIQVPIENGRFPYYIKESQNELEIPLIAAGSNLVKEDDILWEKQSEKISFGKSNKYMAIYLHKFMDKSLKMKIHDIIMEYEA